MVLKIVGSATCPPDDFVGFTEKFVKEVFNPAFASNQPKPFQEEVSPGLHCRKHRVGGNGLCLDTDHLLRSQLPF
jgi:hypothetical protein